MAAAYTNLALVKFNRGAQDTTEVLPLLNQAKDIYQKTFGEKHPLYAEALKNLAKSQANLLFLQRFQFYYSNGQ